MSWLDILRLLAPLAPGFLAGHVKAKRAATTTAQILQFARDAAHVTAEISRSDLFLNLVDRWSKVFAQSLHVAGIDLDDEQESAALAEAREVFQQLGVHAVSLASARFAKAADELRDGLVKMRPMLEKMKAEQKAAKKSWKERAK